jgi:hypothetical protein
MKTASRGTVLAMTLVLLAGLAALALAAAAAAVTALALTGHQQGAAHALEAAEAGVARALQFARVQAGAMADGPLPHDVGQIILAHFETRTAAIEGAGSPPPGFSIGTTDSAFAAQHYVIESTGQATRNARVRIEQGFYVVVPHR